MPEVQLLSSHQRRQQTTPIQITLKIKIILVIQPPQEVHRQKPHPRYSRCQGANNGLQILILHK